MSSAKGCLFSLGLNELSELNIIKPKLNTPLKIAKIDIETKTDGKPAALFWENDQWPELWHILGPKVAQNL